MKAFTFNTFVFAQLLSNLFGVQASVQDTAKEIMNLDEVASKVIEYGGDEVMNLHRVSKKFKSLTDKRYQQIKALRGAYDSGQHLKTFVLAVEYGDEKWMTKIQNEFQISLEDALVLASKDGYLKAVEDLLNMGVDPSVRRQAPLLAALDHSQFDVVKILLKDHRVDPSAGNQQAIRVASKHKGQLELVKILLADPRVDPSANGQEAIRSAATHGNGEVVMELIKHEKVDPSVMRQYVLGYEAYWGHLEVVKALLRDPRVNPAEDKQKAIEFASSGGRVEVVKILLKDPRVDASEDHQKALRSALSGHHYAVVKVLLADPNVIKTGGINEIMKWKRWLYTWKDPELVERALKAGLNPNPGDSILTIDPKCREVIKKAQKVFADAGSLKEEANELDQAKLALQHRIEKWNEVCEKWNLNPYDIKIMSTIEVYEKLQKYTEMDKSQQEECDYSKWSEAGSFLKMGFTAADVLSRFSPGFYIQDFDKHAEVRTQRIIKAIEGLHGNFAVSTMNSNALTAMIKTKRHVKAVEMVLKAGAYPFIDAGVDIDNVYKPVIKEAKKLYEEATKLTTEAKEILDSEQVQLEIESALKERCQKWGLSFYRLKTMSQQDVYEQIQKHSALLGLQA